jgi:tRNA A-37 threonylcarbamoyl transferase component Bud32
MSLVSAPRLLAFTADADFFAEVSALAVRVAPGVLVRQHDAEKAGALPDGFVAAGYDAVLLDGALEQGNGARWLDDFAARAEFPPVLLFRTQREQSTWAAPNLQVHELERRPLDAKMVVDLLHDAIRRRRHTQALVRSRTDAAQRYRFGAVTIRGHRLMRTLAQGGTSTVYLAESERTGEIVALKVLERVPDATGDLRDFERFLDEYQLLADLDHPNIVRITDLGIADDHLFIAMEYFPLGSLRTLMRGALPREESLAIVGDIARALAVVHALGILHRDLKPGNVMLRADGSLALIDFGLADAVEGAATGRGRILGTPEYMSPEQGHGEPLDVRSDLYSLGIILYELAIGTRPFDGDTPFATLYQHRNAPLPALPDQLRDLTPLFERLLAKRPQDRFPDAATAVREIDSYLTWDGTAS